MRFACCGTFSLLALSTEMVFVSNFFGAPAALRRSVRWTCSFSPFRLHKRAIKCREGGRLQAGRKGLLLPLFTCSVPWDTKGFVSVCPPFRGKSLAQSNPIWSSSSGAEPGEDRPGVAVVRPPLGEAPASASDALLAPRVSGGPPEGKGV